MGAGIFRGAGRALALLLAGLMLAGLMLIAPLPAARAEADIEEPLYVENEWNYVDQSMDVSQGIPEDAMGVLERIRRTGVLRVATEPYFPPQEFIDDSLQGQAQYVGADMELARRIAERMGVELQIVPMEFTQVLAAVAENECDLAISALAFTPGRAGSSEMSKGYYFAEGDAGSGVLIRAEDAEKYLGLDDFAGCDIVAQNGSLQESIAAENLRDYRQFRRVSTMAEVYRAVENGEADAAIVDAETALDYIANNPDCGLRVIDGVRIPLDEQYSGDRIAARKGELQLMYFVNGVIDEVLESGEYRQWYEEASAHAARLGM